jgi:hypothetical protein
VSPKLETTDPGKSASQIEKPDKTDFDIKKKLYSKTSKRGSEPRQKQTRPELISAGKKVTHNTGAERSLSTGHQDRTGYIELDRFLGGFKRYALNKNYPVFYLKLDWDWVLGHDVSLSIYGSTFVDEVYPIISARYARARVTPPSLADFGDIVGAQTQLMHFLYYTDALASMEHDSDVLSNYQLQLYSDTDYQSMRANMVPEIIPLISLPPNVLEAIKLMATPLKIGQQTWGLMPPVAGCYPDTPNFGGTLLTYIQNFYNKVKEIQVLRALVPEWSGIANNFHPNDHIFLWTNGPLNYGADPYPLMNDAIVEMWLPKHTPEMMLALTTFWNYQSARWYNGVAVASAETPVCYFGNTVAGWTPVATGNPARLSEYAAGYSGYSYKIS